MTAEKKYLKAEEIPSLDGLTRDEVLVSELGGFLFVRTLTAVERNDIEGSLVSFRAKAKKQGKTDVDELDPETTKEYRTLQLKLVSLCTVDREGNRVFADSDAAGSKSSTIVDTLWDAALKVSKLHKEAVAEEAGNLPEGQKEDSSSD